MRAFAIVPAAGHSVRMGRRKLALPWGGATVLDAVLEAWCRSRVDRTVVVMRRDDRELQTIVGRHEVDVVLPAIDPPDMKASIQAGLAHLRVARSPAEGDVWLVAPADMPLLPTAAIDAVLDAAVRFPNEILVAAHQGQRGHPVLFPWRFADEVSRLPQSGTLRDVMALHPIREIPLDDPRIAVDIDTPEDFERARRWLESPTRGEFPAG